MASRLTVLAKSAYRFLPALRLSVIMLAFACGCQNDGELSNEGHPQLLAPRSVDDYARRRNISNDQAQRELQDAVSKRDAVEAVKNIDEVGVRPPR